ncbi:MAG: class I SAM-dependent methyltransferase [Candidatus Sulfotelmatobacter sp.]
MNRIASPVSVAEGYKRWAASYDQDPNPLLAREERYLLPLLGSLPPQRILDLACGTGRWLELLRRHTGTNGAGIDDSSAMLRFAGEKCGSSHRVAQGNCERLPFRDAAFDLAICSFALGHLTDLKSTAAELERVLQPGANLFISDLHPEAQTRGWRVGFRDEEGPLEIETVLRPAEDVIASFCSRAFERMSEESLWLGDPEKHIFTHAGKSDLFAEACKLPAVIVFHFRRVNTRLSSAEPRS